MNITLNDKPIDFTMSGNVSFTIVDGVINFYLNATVDVQNVRLLEDGGYRLLEDGSLRLLE